MATGGGLFQARNRRAAGCVRNGDTVWLDVPLFQICTDGIGTGTRSAALGARRGSPAAFRALFERRRAAYALAGTSEWPPQGPPEEVPGDAAARLGLRSSFSLILDRKWC